MPPNVVKWPVVQNTAGPFAIGPEFARFGLEQSL